MKNILITGGTSGIGLNAAKRLSRDPKNNLIIVGSKNSKGNLALKELQINSKNASFLKCDLSSLNEIKEFVTINKLPKLDVLINNAGAVFFKKNFQRKILKKHLLLIISVISF